MTESSPNDYFKIATDILNMFDEYSKNNPEKGKKIMNSLLLVVGGGAVCLGGLIYKRVTQASGNILREMAKQGLLDFQKSVEYKAKLYNIKMELFEAKLENLESRVQSREESHAKEIKKFSELVELLRQNTSALQDKVSDMDKIIKDVTKQK